MTKRLLVTDDAMIIREMIKEIAQLEEWEIAGEARDGKEAVEQYVRLKPDCVTLDLVMPEFDGLYALEGILAVDPEAKIVVVSALDQQQTIDRARQLGASDFVIKPFKHQQLQEMLRRYDGSSICDSPTA